VHYRYQKMIERGLLLGINSVYDVHRFGWQIYLVYVKFKSIDNEKEENIIASLKNNPNIAWIIKSIGNYDVILKYFVTDITQLNNGLKKFESLFENYIDNYVIDTVKKEITVPVPFLYSPLPYDWEDEPRKENQLKIDEIDLKILEQLAHNARMQLSDMSKKIKISRDLIKYHLRKLEKEGVILNYRPSAWSGSKSVGYSWYLITMNLRDLSSQKKSSLLAYIKSNPNVTYLYELIGQHDFGFEIRLKTGDELNNVLMEIRALLAGDLKRHELSLILKEFKYTYFPECLKDTNK
ncbi:MAG: winged helix-turn-helix transcriptional regulator, partial [Candidatus Woesearchaeota archaeon]|nr:winged helix-turn-helix transcriptional regulator [Candidatus Woesearchaeota archaeon]